MEFTEELPYSSHANDAKDSLSEDKYYTLSLDPQIPTVICERESTKPSLAPTLCKWVITTLLMLAFLASLVTNKLTVLQLTRGFLINRNVKQDSISLQRAESVSLLLVLMMISPAIAFLRSLWSGALRSYNPWPSCKGIILVII